MEAFNMTKRFNATQINAELFWKFPKFLSENKKYANLTKDDRVAYMLIKDRYRYSLSNNWIDKDKNVYVYFTIEELRQLLHVGKNKVTRVKNRLIDAGLLEIEKDGFNPKDKKNYPDRIYLLQPEYDPTDLISQSSHVSALEQSGIPKMGTRYQNEGNLDNKGKSDSENCNKVASALEQSGIPKMGTRYQNEGNLDNKGKSDSENCNKVASALEQSGIPKMGTRYQNEGNLDNKGKSDSENCNKVASALEQSGIPKMGTNKDNNSSDTIKDTDQWNFSTNNYTPEQVAAQNQDLLSHLGETLTGDKEAPMFLNKDSINLIAKWFRTPEGASECISTILNAANDSRKNAESQINHHELYFEDYNSELKRLVTNRLRRYFNKMRTSDKIKNPKNYLYVSMRNMFDKWQNDVLMAEKDKANNKN
ncbi:replication initiator protein A [Lactobacillus helveticus]|uniref:replication initiator protein A n=1 Tax=Lactobacillus helveticus TaxID=1587 RepID=UPI0020B7E2A4|nr:replication initiator protein A [Lactobacillus helveticus]